jgi:hypothetical protein
MALTKEIIVSLAVQLLGHKPIITLDEADDLVLSAEQAFDMLLPSVLSSGNWRFAVQIAQLSLSVETPPPGSNWSNIYLLPAGYLKNIRVIPQNYDYEIYENNKIYCNWGNSQMLMEYAFMPSISQLPMHFVNYFIYEIGAFLALCGAQKPEFYTVLESRRQTALAMAAATDASNRPNFSQVVFPVLAQRQIGGIIGNANT